MLDKVHIKANEEQDEELEGKNKNKTQEFTP